MITAFITTSAMISRARQPFMRREHPKHVRAALFLLEIGAGGGAVSPARGSQQPMGKGSINARNAALSRGTRDARPTRRFRCDIQSPGDPNNPPPTAPSSSASANAAPQPAPAPAASSALPGPTKGVQAITQLVGGLVK